MNAFTESRLDEVTRAQAPRLPHAPGWTRNRAVASSLNVAASFVREAIRESGDPRTSAMVQARHYLNRARSIRMGVESPNPYSRWSA